MWPILELVKGTSAEVTANVGLQSNNIMMMIGQESVEPTDMRICAL